MEYLIYTGEVGISRIDMIDYSINCLNTKGITISENTDYLTIRLDTTCNFRKGPRGSNFKLDADYLSKNPERLERIQLSRSGKLEKFIRSYYSNKSNSRLKIERLELNHNENCASFSKKVSFSCDKDYFIVEVKDS